MMSMWNAPSDLDYYNQFDSADDELPQSERDSDQEQEAD